MPDKKFDLGDYIEVKDRIAILYELYPQGRLVTDEVTILTAPDDRQRVMVKALAYRTPDDPHPGVGFSWMELPGTTSYTKGSELENTETSAWGRAIASLGILIDRSIASAQEVANKAGGEKVPEKVAVGETLEILGNLRKSGIVVKGTSARYGCEFFMGPSGHVLGFKLKLDGDKDIPQVLCDGEIGEALFLATGGDSASLIGQKVSVRGRLHAVRVEKRRPYYRLVVTEITTDDWHIPAPLDVAPETSAEPPEAESAPLWDADESARIDAAEAAAAR
jgi:hypothetical protein